MKNKIEIIPTVFAFNKKEFNDKLKKVNFSSKIHLDFMDGQFTNNSSVSLPDMNEILNYTKIHFSLHLMAQNPLKYISQIKKLKIKDVFVHVEIFKNNNQIQTTHEEFERNNINMILTINPQTSILKIENFFNLTNKFNSILFMGVLAGAENQKFNSSTLSKIKEFKTKFPKITIHVDGGIKDTNIYKIIQAGANILYIGSYLSSENSNAKNKYITLLKITE